VNGPGEAAAAAVLTTSGHGWWLAGFPLIAAAVAALFALSLARRFAARPQPPLGLWAVALAMFAAASLAMFLGVKGGWSGGEFRVYWLFGAILNVPFLAVGEVYLLTRRRSVGHAVLGLLLVGTAFAVWKVAAAPLATAALAKALPLGKDVFGDGSAPYRISQVYAFPAYFLLLGGVVWSAWQMRGRPDLRNRTGGAGAIAFGATIVAVGSGVGAGFNVVPLFSVGLAAGVTVMYLGFLTAQRPADRRAGSSSPR
jgi:hypothetical protein